MRDWVAALDIADEFSENLVELEVFARDRYAAVEKFIEEIEKLRAITALSPSHVLLRWWPQSFVKRPNARSGSVVGKYDAIFNDLQLDTSGTAANQIRRSSQYLAAGFLDSSKERISSALSYAHLAKASLSDESRMISIWSAFEILVRNPPIGQTRIVHYREMISPLICRRYGRDSLLAVKQYVERVEDDVLAEILDEIAADREHDLPTFAHLLCGAEYEREQDRLFQLFQDNPLMQYRLWAFRKNFARPKAYQRSVKAHIDRVNWQIERIYRARNQIVHAGQTPKFIDSLSKNAEEYFRATANPLVARGKNAANLDLDDVFAEFHLEFEAYLKRLRTTEGEDRFSSSQIEFFFS